MNKFSRKSRLRHCSLRRPVNCSHTHSRCMATCYSLAAPLYHPQGTQKFRECNNNNNCNGPTAVYYTRAFALCLPLSLSLPIFRSPALRQQQVSVPITTTAAQLAQTSRNKCRTKLSSGSTMPRLAVVEQFENDFRARQTCKDVLEFECEQKERKKDKFIYSQATIEVKKKPKPKLKSAWQIKRKSGV